MMTRNASREIATEEKKVNHKEDRLSNLPDEILIKILSYLRTKEAVRTGILSTRWKSVWASVPTLDLCILDFSFKGEDNIIRKVEARFSNFVDRVLVARKLPLLEKIRIVCSDVDHNIMISWMRAALERNVSELDVNFFQFSGDPMCELTHDLFSYNKLVVLKLCVDMTLYFPTASSCFPNLKVLELEYIFYRDNDSLPNLLSSCHVLEDLAIIRSRWDNLGTLNITSRSLKRLIVASSFVDFGEQVDVLKMVIDAPAVESLDISCQTTKEYVAKDLSSIVEAKLKIFNIFKCYLSASDTENGYKFLRGISNVKFLRLDPCTVGALMFTISYNLPMFNNLTRLEIYGDERCGPKRWKSLQWKLMLEILKCSPMLEILIYQEWEYSYLPEKCDKVPHWDVPDCLVSHLKTVEIDYRYRESHYDVEKVKYFLINARVLKKMTIRSPFSKKILNNICEILENQMSLVTLSENEIVLSFL